MNKGLSLACYGLLAGLAGLFAPPAGALERVYYVAADEIEWDYAPAGRNAMMGRPFTEPEQVFVGRSAGAIGSRYRKVVFREYTDASFTTLKPRPPEWSHLGILGPLFRAEVGDTIRVVFRNHGSRPYSIHPHGVFYDKGSEGAGYADGTSGADRRDDRVAPGATHTYRWGVPERAGPGPNDPSSIAWLYHSHVHSVEDANTGLIGAMIVTARGQAREDGGPRGIDREFVNLFMVFDENQSWLLDDNIRRYADPGRVDRRDEAFVEGNRMHAINGYVYGSQPGLEMDQCENVRWYLLALGSEIDLHTPHWHGNTGLHDGHRVDVVDLLPASHRVLDMQPDAAGTWMYHCHVNDHIKAGMTALYTVHAAPDAVCSDVR